ncbi:MAG TPA: hypothetical protein VII28_06900 [Puia sp.]
MKEIESTSGELKSRRKLLTGIGILSLFSIWRTGVFNKKKTVISCAPPVQKETMKLLSQDGRLVEVDIAQIKSTLGKISDQDLQGWIKKL